MSADKLKEKLKSIVEAPHSMQVYFVLKAEGQFTIKLADIEEESTAPELQRMFVGYINNSLIENEELAVRDLSVADEHVGAVYRYDYESYPEELGIFKSFNISEAVETEKFNFQIDDLSHLYGYIIYIGTMTEGIALFKKHYHVSLIKRDSFLLGAIKSAGRFEKLPGEDIIRLNDSVQLLRVDDNIYVLDLKMLERNMGFTMLVEKAAEESIAAIDNLGIVEDVQVLKDALEATSFSRKLSKVKKASPIFALGITKEAIINFTKTTAELAGKFKYSDDGTQIRLDTKKSKDAFLKLMNDAFLRSELTKQYYETSAKDRIKSETA